MKKKLLALCLVMVMLCCPLSVMAADDAPAGGSRAGEELRFVVVPKCVHAWFDLVYMGAIREANKLNELTGMKIKVEYNAPSSTDVTEQNTILQQVAATQPAGILLDPNDFDGSKAILDEIKEQGIEVVLFDAPPADGYSSAGCDFIEMGTMAATALVEALDGKGKVAIMMGVPTAPNHTQRYEAEKAVLEQYPDIEIVAEGVDNDDIETAQSQMASIIAAHPDLDGMLCCNASGPIGIANAIKEAGLEDQIYAVGMDGIQEILDAVKEGALDESVASIPQKQGSMGCLLLFQAITGLNDMPKEIDTGINHITQDNIDQYLQELADLYALLEVEGVQE